MWAVDRIAPLIRPTALLGWLFIAIPASAQPAPEAASQRQEKAEARARTYMAATAHPLATEAAVAMLRRGGNALDAAVAAQMMLGLVEPQSSGIGGGALILYWDAANKQLHAFDGRETAPAAARPERFLKSDGKPMGFAEAVPSGLSVGVPGAVAALEMAHKAHGRLPWSALIAPAIARAEQGFAVTPRLHQLLTVDPLLRNDADAASLYYPDGKPLAVGAHFSNPAYAQSLRQIAGQGAAALQRGPLADAMLAKLQARGSDMTATDLAAYQPKQRPELCGSFRVYRICGFGPPSSGGIAVLQILGILEALDPNPSAAFSVVDIHRFSEAGRLAFADRDLYVADSDFVSVPVAGLIDKGYLTERARLIRTDASLGKAQAGSPPGRRGALPGLWPQADLPGTSHVSIIDSQGNGLSMTTTIESAFGARMLVAGFLLNNQLTDFSFMPEIEGRLVANRIQPGKRPRSSMAPTLVFDASGDLLMAAGSPGGSMIINYVAQNLFTILDRGFSPQMAVSQPHFGSRNGPTELETGADPAWAEALQRLGHRVQTLEMTSGLHIVMRPGNGLLGGVDPRREGLALGD